MIYHFFSAKYIHLTPFIIQSIIDTRERTLKNVNDEFLFYIENTSGSVFEKVDIEGIYKQLRETNPTTKFKFVTSKFKLFMALLKATSKDLIFLHSSLNYRVLAILNIILYLFSWKSKAQTISYVCWGGDFGYNNQFKKCSTLKEKILAHIYSKVWPTYRNIITLIEKDAEYVKTIYHTDNVQTIPYPSYRKAVHVHKDSHPLRIMVSHSGWPHNHHIETLNLLSRFKNEDVEIICPLCYGDPKYIEKVITEGKKIFNNRFKYFIDLMNSDDYIELVRTCHIFITGADIQTGLGAINLHIEGNSKVFLRGILYDELINQGYKIYNYSDIKTLSYDEMIKPNDDNNNELCNLLRHNTFESTVNKLNALYNRN